MMRWLPIPELSQTLEGLEAETTVALRISRSTRRLERLRDLPQLLSVQLENASEAVLEQVCRIETLEHLVLEPFGLKELAPVGRLVRLRSLILSSGGWGRTGRVRTFAPLWELRQLESVQTNLVPEDGDLTPLAGSAKMRAVQVAPGLYAMEAMARLAAALRPEDRTGAVSGVVVLYAATACARCGAQGTHLLLSGARRGAACSACQQQKLQRHRQRWAELVEKAEAGRDR